MYHYHCVNRVSTELDIQEFHEMKETLISLMLKGDSTFSIPKLTGTFLWCYWISYMSLQGIQSLSVDLKTCFKLDLNIVLNQTQFNNIYGYDVGLIQALMYS